MTHFRPGTVVPASGIYWCTVCKLPKEFAEGQTFPECENMCGRGQWQPAPRKDKEPGVRS
jgi:hypothetical protein